MTMAQKYMIHHCIGNHSYFRNWSCKTMNHVWIAPWIREALEKHTKCFSSVTSCPLVTADSDWYLKNICQQCPVYALWTPLNTLIHLSGRNQTSGTRYKGSLDSWNCNFRTKSKILRHWCFHCCTKKEASFSCHWRMTFSHTAYLFSHSFILTANKVCYRRRCRKLRLLLNVFFFFLRERRCFRPRLFRSLKLPLPLKRPVLKGAVTRLCGPFFKFSLVEEIIFLSSRFD